MLGFRCWNRAIADQMLPGTADSARTPSKHPAQVKRTKLFRCLIERQGSWFLANYCDGEGQSRGDDLGCWIWNPVLGQCEDCRSLSEGYCSA